MNDHLLRTYDSMLGMLSSVDNPTPLVRLNAITGFEHTEVFVKLEWYNPFGSVKDRVASNMILRAEEDGDLLDHDLVEPTSGNTGLGLAMVGNALGYDLTTPLSRAIPIEKRTMLRFFGAEVEELDDDLCPAPWAPEGAIARAMEIAEKPDFHMLNQYKNPSNPDSHYRTTGPEIWRQTEGTITHFVSGMGTCGTITGTGRFLKEQDRHIQVIGVHPAEGHDIPGVRSIRQLEQTEFFQPDEYDRMVEIDNRAAYQMTVRLNREESIPAGPSSGLALAGALASLPDEPGHRVVVVFPDSIFKYASSVAKHVAELGTAAAPKTTSRREELFDAIIEHTRHNPHLTIDIETTHDHWKRDRPFVLDVRQPEEFDQGHIPGAMNIPLLDLPDRADLLPADLETPVLAVCQRGNISLPAVLYLSSLGFRNARSVTGGTNAWVERGFEVDSS
ncbi:MAG TPA: pyridoxal-phosphate dependent enzyme [Acidimicrobiia bacterium]|nr:pyridoxal-phosphate dependent enzyme [Acidimicrobiia bacterium]